MATVLQFPANGNARPVQEEQLPENPGQRQGEAALCQWVMGLWHDAQTMRDASVPSRIWDAYETGYWGQHWPANLPSYKMPIVINELKRLILHELSDLTDFTPTVYVMGNPQTRERDQNVETAIQSFWTRNFVDLAILEGCLDAAIWPCGFLECIWNPRAAQGQGDIEVRARHPATVWPDPTSPDDARWRYVMTREIMDVHEIRLHYPDHGWRVRPDASRPIGPSPNQETLFGRFGGGGVVTPMYPVASPIPTQGQDTRAAVYTIYVKDSTPKLVPESFKTPDGEMKMRQVTRYKYPYGRHIICTADVVLQDVPSSYRAGFPIIRMLMEPSVHHFWPKTSLVSEQMNIQQAADKLESLVVENALRLQKGMIFMDSTSGIDPQRVGQFPGEVHLKTPGSQVQVEFPPPLPPDLVMGGSRLRDEMARQMGQQGARLGTAAPGNRSADLTETEISQGQGITRLRGRYLQHACVRLVQHIFTGMADFYRTPRIMPHFADDQWAPLEWQPLVNPDKYAIHVDPNSFTIQSKSMVKRLAVALTKLNAMPLEDLYRILEFPQGKEIAMRKYDEMKLQAQANQKKRRS